MTHGTEIFFKHCTAHGDLEIFSFIMHGLLLKVTDVSEIRLYSVTSFCTCNFALSINGTAMRHT